MQNSLTDLKRESFVVKKLLSNIDYAEIEEIPEIELEDFEGKPFKYLSSEQLLNIVVKISRKFKRLGFVNDFYVKDHEETSKKARMVFDLKNKIPVLHKYLQQLNLDIASRELEDKTKKGNYFWYQEKTKTFYFTLPNGLPQAIQLSDKMFLVLKILYDYWVETNGEIMKKSLMKTELDKFGWSNVSDTEIKNYVGNIRKTKIAPLKLSNYISVDFDRKQDGYKMIVSY